MLKKLLVSVITMVLIMCCFAENVNATEYRTVNCENEETQIAVLQGETKTDATGNYQYQELDDGTVTITKYVGSETAVVMPTKLDGKTVTKINRMAFYNTPVVSVVIADTVLCIGDYAFDLCKQLESIYIPASVNEIQVAAFYGCTNLSKIEVAEGNAAFVAKDNILYTKDMKELIVCGVGKEKVEVPVGVETIRIYAFCQNPVKEVVLPEGLVRIEDDAFGGAQLEKINLPESLEYIAQNALRGTNITELAIPRNVKYIGNNALGQNKKLEKLTVSEANAYYVVEDNILYTKDKKELLYCVGNRESIVINSKVEKIGTQAFYGMTNLREVTLPEGLKEIGQAAFGECWNLREITIPQSVERVKLHAFTSCMYMQKVTVLSKACVLEAQQSMGGDLLFTSTAVLYGYDGSTLEEYAKTYNRNFVSLGEAPLVIADVSTKSWQYPYVKYAIENKLASGKGMDALGNVLFDPESKMTRAEFIQLLYNKEGKPEVAYESIFNDVPEGKWFTKAIVWGYKNNLISGKKGIFDVNGNITREEVATILYKYAANYKKYDTTGAADLSGYEDVEEISSWAVNNMKWAIQYNVMKGRGSKIAPSDNATRAECITMLINFINEYEKSE